MIVFYLIIIGGVFVGAFCAFMLVVKLIAWRVGKASSDTDAFERATDGILPFFTKKQAKALVAFRGDENLRGRIEELAAKNTEGELTPIERGEYEGYVRANKFIAILQAKARKLLNGS